MLSFIRSDLNQFNAYQPHPGGEDGAPVLAEVDRLDTNESPYDLPPELKQKLAFATSELIESNRYPDGSHASLKQAVATYVNETISASGAIPHAITPAQISIGNGSDELIRSILIATCLNGEGSILVANPTFSMYEIIAKSMGIPVVAVGRSETDFAIDLDAAQKAVTETGGWGDGEQGSGGAGEQGSKGDGVGAIRESPLLSPLPPGPPAPLPPYPPIRVVFVVHPNSPTANPLTPAEIDWLRSLPDYILVAIDEAYYEFSGHTLVGELKARPNWVILRTFSKAFRLAAARVGYAVGSPELIGAIEKIRLPYNLPSFSQAAAHTALLNRHLLSPAIDQIKAQRDRLIPAFSQLPWLQVWPSGANFIYLRPNSLCPLDAAQIAASLKAKGTLIRHTGGGLRITVGTPEENDRTLERLRALV
ncbi:aminotransferase class I/II-fold pyridoxal phosphate-dependent enzyme [[Phormidium] sp. ETS-05]|uniref:aminotransferase class I/II-fold pyridoxal phosphate-dependent enzyme n=1 Tax=[Phormidium] sp. ETS-05 TaxID=222819 RepID=UPI001E3D8BBC|nr:aminotransferase class I/II-fold pyridoxal phosphate-dependent enzyme [[Phormidium] sp. ETS-05]